MTGNTTLNSILEKVMASSDRGAVHVQMHARLDDGCDDLEC